MARRPDAGAVLLLLAGLLLAVTASISLVASLTALPAEPTLEALRERRPVSPDEATAAARTSLAAAGRFEEGRYLTDAALAAMAAPAGAPKAGAIVSRAVAAQPASPYNWTRLAMVRQAAGDPDAAVRAWEMSVLVGRYAPGLVLPRLEIGFQLLAAASPEQIRLLGDQVRIAAETDPKGLAVAARRQRVEPFVRVALLADPDLLDAFNAAQAAQG